MNRDTNVNLNFSYLNLLTIVFIVLKLCKVIDWSWWWVLAPTWIPAGIFVIIVIALLIWKKVTRF